MTTSRGAFTPQRPKSKSEPSEESLSESLPRALSESSSLTDLMDDTMLVLVPRYQCSGLTAWQKFGPFSPLHACRAQAVISILYLVLLLLAFSGVLGYGVGINSFHFMCFCVFLALHLILSPDMCMVTFDVVSCRRSRLIHCRHASCDCMCCAFNKSAGLKDAL